MLVTGNYFREGDTVSFRAKVLDAATGRVLQVLPFTLPIAHLQGISLPWLSEWQRV